MPILTLDNGRRCRSNLLRGFITTALVLLASCSRTPDQLLQRAADYEEAVRKHHIRKDPEAAGEAAKKAWQAAEALEKLAKSNTNDLALAEQTGEAFAHARGARDEAELCREEWEYSKALNGLAARSYRKTRAVICNAVLNALADTAELAANTDPASLSPVKRELSNAARSLVETAGLAPGPNANAKRDWKEVAGELRSYTTNPAPAFSLALACGFLGLGQADLALAEMESVSKDRLQTTNDFLMYHGGRCLIYLSRGWTHLSGVEFAALCENLEKGGAIDGRTAASLYHAYLAIEAGSKRDLVTLDAELAKAVQAWPENPWLVFVTGEKLAANGQWEQAAESLEKEARGSKHEWAARRFAQRARDLRDGKGSAKSLVLDAGFLGGLALDWAAAAARDSGVGQKILNFKESSSALAQAALKNIPFLGSAEKAQPPGN